jgi:twinkle protein
MSDSYTNDRYRCPDCDSSDGLALNTSGTAYCHACPEETAFKPKTAIDIDGLGDPSKNTSTRPHYDARNVMSCKDYRPFHDRGISLETSKFYDVPTTVDDVVVFHYSADAAKLRFPSKDFTTTKGFKEAGLFGEDKFSKGRKSTSDKFKSTVTITEGEFDTMAAYQMQGSRYPTVSVKSGASGAMKDCKASFDWLNSFDKIVICFDADEPGQKAAAKVAKLFGDKAAIMKHVKGYKDACDYTANKDGKAFNDAWWASESYTPDGIVASSQLYEEVMKPLEMPFCSYPWDCLNLMFYGMYPGTIVTLLAGSGVGKSTVVKAILREVYETTQHKIGVLSLEETVGVAGLGMMSMEANTQLHLPTREQMKAILKDPTRVSEKPYLDDVTPEARQAQKEAAYDNVLKSGRFMFLQHEGHITVDSILAQMRYLSKAQDCKILLLDHINILVGLVSNGKTNEREAIDGVMHELRKLVEETGIMLLNICHLRKASDGVGHEEGRRVQASEARGSAAIIQLSDAAIALEGNRQSDVEAVRNCTTLRGLKNRRSGETGIAGYLQYSQQTGRLTEAEDINIEEAL